MAPLSPYDLRTAAGRGPERFPAGHRWDSSPKIRFAQDSPLEGDGFEPSVPRDTTKLRRRLMSLLLDSRTRKSRREREPTPRGCGAPPAEPMVRIRLPPAASQERTLWDVALGQSVLKLRRQLDRRPPAPRPGGLACHVRPDLPTIDRVVELK
jgi:hypothetical protein